ncbi:hypothetical protein KQI38_01040 [Tissierella carlieri]|uniref:hypothetical protein n=1 Tax=Tissierella carlieri TaxID=689904 RepID=UPI001C10D842|nr:hypothetical protein [Tissierella carlieri]MBU5310599.1 hypothetical protein [Tissierella carlieri]
MILKRMRMKNFFRYYGEQVIEFVHDGEKNVTAIKGENGRGKTTILSAFSWCFYGETEKPLTTDKMYNKRARATLKEGDIDSVFVEIDFIDKNTEYTIYREQDFKLHNGTMIPTGEEKIDITYKDHIGNRKKVIDTRNFFNNIIPINLRQFFFFDGERINRLAQEEGREEIKEAILNILGLNVIENLMLDLETVSQRLNREIKKYLKDKEADLSDQKDDLINLKQNIEKEYNELVDLKRGQETERESISMFLISHNSEVVASLESERRQLEKDHKLLNEDIKDIDKRINKLFTTKAKDMLIMPYTCGIYEMLEDRREKGELPSDIKDTFIKDLIEKGVCICGTKVEQGSTELKKLQELLKTAGRRELDDAYIRIISYINNNEGADSNFFKEYNKLLSLEEAKQYEIQRKNNRIKQIDEDIKGIDIEEIARKTEYRKVLEKKLVDTKADIMRKKERIQNIDKEIERLTIEIEKAEIKNNEAIKINSQINKVRQLIKLNNQVHEAFKEEVRRDLDKRIKEVFKSISHKEYREPVLTEDLVLKVVNNFNTTLEEEVLSTGESQVSSLSFIGALVSYSRDKQDSELYSSFMGGDFPIVMDSPFGNLDSLHSAHIAKGIGDLSNQVVIIVSQKQWGSEVEKNIYHRLGKMYELVEGDIFTDEIGEYTYIKEVRI